MGGLYARVQPLDEGLPEATRFAIADAIYDHYKPESMEDELPRSVEGAMLSLADKADTIAGMFALGMQPTGSKDPFALRRQGNGIVRIIAEKKFPLPIAQLFADARETYRGTEADKRFSPKVDYIQSIKEFFRERLEFYLRDALGFKYDVVNAVLAADADDVVDAVARAKALSAVRPSADFEAISIAFKRIKNILRQARDAGKQPATNLETSGLKEEAERLLADQVPQVSARVQTLKDDRSYETALSEIATLRPVVDKFFDKVMVMVDDERLRANRLALLQTLLKEFSTIADFSEIVTDNKEPKESSKQ